ncbi:hypothetical protein K0I73_16660 [Shewanella mesophila]|uniref:hypothetical protein n=1 Tax=Shewanella mesophila TaxID=2864208 RepID=UPI001C65D2CD|nr:hypothetical protein [Shewanella mesophila]QYJ85782.1 hypothetical protein K0I73_16660 [Shewanella mesophila]
MRTSTILSFPLMAILLLGCNDEVKSQPTQEKQATETKTVTDQLKASDNIMIEKPQISQPKGIVMRQGTVRYINLEGGFWGIINDDGSHLLPQNLAKEYRKDGLRLSYKAQEIKDMMTIQQWGILSNLSDVKVIGQVESQNSDPRI